MDLERPRLPDINSEQTQNSLSSTIDWVGMEDILFPLQMTVADEKLAVSSSLDLKVNLNDPKARGIHMSRLYQLVDGPHQSPRLTLQSLPEFLKAMVGSQNQLSTSAQVGLKFDFPMQKETLRSQRKTWQSYKVEIQATLSNSDLQILTTVQILYSSTCPNSAALAQELNTQEVEKNWSKRAGSQAEFVSWYRDQAWATPHAQKSRATVTVASSEISESQIQKLILLVEDTLGTPVQSLVKREDEMEFARLNGQNLMFCEDAVRKISLALTPTFKKHQVKVVHFESLHAHNASSSIATF